MITPKIIERYIFRKALVATLVATMSLTAIVWVVKAFQGIDLVSSKGQSVFLYLYMTTLGVPTLISVILPIGLLLGVMNCISGMNNDSELVVINASGASQSIILKPLITLGLFVSVAVMAIALYYGPASLSLLRTFVTQVRSDLVSVIIKEGEFSKIGNGIVFHIAERAPGGLLKGIFMLDQRSTKETFTYVAQQGSIVKENGKSFILLQEGQIQRVARNKTNVSVIKFKSYAFDLSSFSGSGKSKSRLREVSTFDLLFPDKNSSNFKRRPGALRAEAHNRITSGLYPFAFVLIIMAISGRARSTRQGYALSISIAFILAALLRGTSLSVVNGSSGSTASIAVIYLLPVIGMLIPAIYIYLGKQIALPKFAQVGVDAVQIWFETRYQNWRDRKLLNKSNSTGAVS